MRGAPGAERLLGLFAVAGRLVRRLVVGWGVWALGRTLRKRNDVPIAVVSGFYLFYLSGENPDTKANAPLLHIHSVFSAV
ncbi:hypothetical protein C162_28729 [Paenibacillus sp. FSL R7-269]|nr:hypothetical protein C162_28729 [Paenibacillus sp. FSL R7-269]